MSEKMANNNELEHKRLVETYLNNNVKSNSKIISRADLIKMKDYLETGNSSQLEYSPVPNKLGGLIKWGGY